MNITTKLARANGMLPDHFWYQLNHQSAQENLEEQRTKIYDQLTEKQDGEIVMMVNVKRSLK